MRSSVALGVAGVFMIVGISRPAISDGPSAAVMQERMKSCIAASADRSMSASAFYDDCVAAYNYVTARNKTGDTNHGDMVITAAILDIYAGGAAFELGRQAEGRSRVIAGRDMLLKVAATSDDANVRHRATTMKACLIDRDPACLKKWAAATHGSMAP